MEDPATHLTSLMRVGVVEGVLLISSLDVGDSDVWIDLLTLPSCGSRGDLGRVLVRLAINDVGQIVFNFDGNQIPPDHHFITCRVLALGGTLPTVITYRCWLVGCRAS